MIRCRGLAPDPTLAGRQPFADANPCPEGKALVMGVKDYSTLTRLRSSLTPITSKIPQNPSGLI